MSDISHQISTKKRTLIHMPDTSIFNFGPTIHLHPQQQNCKEWLDMRNMVLQRTKQFSQKVHSKSYHASSSQSFTPTEMESTTVSESTQLDDDNYEQTKKRRRRKKKKSHVQ